MTGEGFFLDYSWIYIHAPNDLRYRSLVSRTRQRHFDGTSFKPRKVPENAQSPTGQVRAVLAVVMLVTHQGLYVRVTIILLCFFALSMEEFF